MIIQYGNTGFNSEAFKDWTEDQFFAQFGKTKPMVEVWVKLQELNRGSITTASIPVDSEDEPKLFKKRRRRKK